MCTLAPRKALISFWYGRGNRVGHKSPCTSRRCAERKQSVTPKVTPPVPPLPPKFQPLMDKQSEKVSVELQPLSFDEENLDAQESLT